MRRRIVSVLRIRITPDGWAWGLLLGVMAWGSAMAVAVYAAVARP